MTRATAILGAVVTLLPIRAAAQEPPRSGVPAETLYADVRAKDRAVRTALLEPDAPVTVLKAVRTVIADYEGLVRQYPRSEFSDDALWFAGWLSLDAFDKFADEHERTAARRLWRALVAQYPTSRLAKAVPSQLARIDTGRVGAERVSTEALAKEPVVPAPARTTPSRSTLATLKQIRRTVLADTVRVTLELDAEVIFHDERLDRPDRVFVDLPATRATPQLVDRTLRFDSDADAVRQIRIGRHPNNTVRVVLDVDGVAGYSVYPLYNPYRLVIDCVRSSRPAATSGRTAPAPADPVLAPRSAPPPPLLRGRNLVSPVNRYIPAALPGLPPYEEPAPPLESVEVTAAATIKPPAANLTGGFSMARQLGLGVSRIAIDPGHGGHDPGATGKGITEAALVLDVALRLEKLLEKTPGLEVILTRRTDDFVSLQERTAIANRESADLFLSIHANASGNAQAHGVETYFLNFATTSAAAAVAARENASSGQAMGALPDFVKAIALHNKLDESKDFATYVQRAMVEKLAPANKGVKDLGVKQAPFVVLIGASMPSVLAEISFLSNSNEVKLLRGSAYRQRIAEALFDAIRKYQASLKRDVKVTQ